MKNKCIHIITITNTDSLYQISASLLFYFREDKDIITHANRAPFQTMLPFKRTVRQALSMYIV